MNEAIKERISALVDGELSEFELRRVLEEIEANPELRNYWMKLKIGNLLDTAMTVQMHRLNC